MSVKVVFMGMYGQFSAIPLARLMAAGVDVMAVVAPASGAPAAPIVVLDPPPSLQADFVLQPTQRSIVHLAWDNAIPALAVSSLRHPQTLSLLRALRPGVIVVACFPLILPTSLLRLPKHGCFNLHPSLLPAMRGSDPLFWVFHEGYGAGISLHRMSERVDAGDLVAQKPLEFPDGITYAEAEHTCAQWGARLLLDAIRSLERGGLETYPQDETRASYFPPPSRDDFIVTPEWSARRAFNFMRGVQGLGSPIVRVDDREFVVREAVGYDVGKTTAETHHVENGELWLRCADGVVRLSVA